MELIAEVGCNWTDMGNAKDYIHKCKELGIKFVKFQMFKPEQVPASVKHLIIGKREAAELFAYGQLEDVNVFFTPFYVEAVDILEELGVQYYKIRYDDRFNEKLKSKLPANKTCYISCNFWDPWSSWDIIFRPMICVPKYPAPIEDYYIQGFIPGISDHTSDLQLFKEAKISGTLYFEMHVCFSHDNIEGKWSKTFDELEEVL